MAEEIDYYSKLDAAQQKKIEETLAWLFHHNPNPLHPIILTMIIIKRQELAQRILENRQ